MSEDYKSNLQELYYEIIHLVGINFKMVKIEKATSLQ